VRVRRRRVVGRGLHEERIISKEEDGERDGETEQVEGGNKK
jgi:hypothetical protein